MTKLINQFDPIHKTMLENLQGNILKGHGRGNTYNIFFKIRDTSRLSEEMQKEFREMFKEWLRGIADENNGIITSAKKQLEQNIQFKKHKTDGGTFACVHLSYSGYCALLGQVKTDEKIDQTRNVANFLALRGGGMKNAGLNDDLGVWDDGFKGIIDGMILIADNNEANLESVRINVEMQLSEFASIVAIEKGTKLENDEGAGIEHFGYVDGISQPIFFQDEMSSFLENHGLHDTKQLDYDPSASKDLVLVDDPFINHREAFGSFFVFRKLEQNVRGFKKAEKDLGFTFGLKGDDKERVGAMIVGRFEDGTPVQVSETEGIIGRETFNNFKYDGDISKCPFHAHIRKTNPRDDLGINESKKHVMARRGIPFGTRKDDPNDGIIENKPTGGVGLLFMSYQASIPNQFEVIQREWANNPDFVSVKTGLDLIIGNGKFPALGVYPKDWGNKTNPQNDIAGFDKFVTMRGGEYFFTPSIPFLRSL